MQNPVYTDGTTITGDGTSEHPLAGVGGGGTPGGADTAIQFNDAGAFAGNATDGFTIPGASIFPTGEIDFIAAPGEFGQFLGGDTASMGLQIDGTTSPNDLEIANEETGGTLNLESNGPLSIESDASDVSILSDSSFVEITAATEVRLNAPKIGLFGGPPQPVSKFLSWPPWGVHAADIATVNFINAAIGLTANAIVMFPIFVPYPVQVQKFAINILTDDAANHYDFGIYDLDGNLIVSLGPTIFGATGVIIKPVKLAATVLAPGMYWFAVTADHSPIITTSGYAGNTNEAFGLYNNLVGNPGWFSTSTASVGGDLPNTIVPPAPVAAANVDQSSLVTDPGSRPIFGLTAY
jgi:hypothetical protein